MVPRERARANRKHGAAAAGGTRRRWVAWGALATVATVAAAVAALAWIGWDDLWRQPSGKPAPVPARYGVTSLPAGGHRVAVPFLGVEAWLPAEPQHHEMHEQTPFGFLPVEEVGVTVRELDFTGCSLSWYATDGAADADARLDEVVRGHVKRLVGQLVESHDLRIGGRPAKESLIRMIHPPNEGAARVRHVLVDGWVVALHTFRYKAMEPNETITRCLDSLVVPPPKD